jgi:hemoglobin-like flavoprotein
MTQEQKDEIRNSWNMVQPMADKAGLLFYQKLFSLAPGVRSLFKNDITDQANKLMQVLKYVVEHLDNMQSLQEEIKALGSRHSIYGAEPSHYEAVGSCLLETLAELLGKHWTPEVKHAWTTAYYQIKQTMILAQTKVHSGSNN